MSWQHIVCGSKWTIAQSVHVLNRLPSRSARFPPAAVPHVVFAAQPPKSRTGPIYRHVSARKPQSSDNKARLARSPPFSVIVLVSLLLAGNPMPFMGWC